VSGNSSASATIASTACEPKIVWKFALVRKVEGSSAPLDVKEYTDVHHPATVPHTLVLGPGLKIEKVYVGYWFWGRPTIHQLWEDLQELTRRVKADYDPTVSAVREAYERSQQTPVGVA
jgi:hypothetical protein